MLGNVVIVMILVCPSSYVCLNSVIPVNMVKACLKVTLVPCTLYPS